MGLRRQRWDFIFQRIWNGETRGDGASGYDGKVKESLAGALSLINAFQPICCAVSSNLLSPPQYLASLVTLPLPIPPNTHTPQISPPASVSSLKCCKCLMRLNPTSAEVWGWAVYTHGLDFWIKAEGWKLSQIFLTLRETPQCMAKSWNSTLTLQCCKPCFSLKITFSFVKYWL